MIQKPPELRFQPPLKKYKITQKYKPSGRDVHLGLDLKAPLGSAVLSEERGFVVYIGRQFTGCGKLVIIEHDRDGTSLYAHLNSFQVKAGQKIQKGQIIGAVGNTGRSAGAHLHFELFLKKRNVNPLDYLSLTY